MPSCFICGRSRNAKTKSENITFHRFPSKSFILQKWHAFIIGNNLKLENIKKNSLICSCHFIPESFIVYNKHRILQTHAVPTIVIKRVKYAKITFPELKQETIQPTSSISSTSQFQTKKILVKITDNSELGILPLVNLESAQSMASVSSDAINSSTNTKITDNSELEHGILPLVNLESAQSMASVSSDAINSSTNTKITSNNEPMNSPLQLVDNNLDQSMENASPDTFNSPIRTGKVMSAYLTASEISVDDSPQRSFLKRRIRQLLNEIQIKNSKIKKLQHTICRQDKKIIAMKEIIKNLKK